MSNKVIVNGIDMIELIERDTPMKPIKYKLKDAGICYYVCPECEEMIVRGGVFCKDCGQRLDWSGVRR